MCALFLPARGGRNFLNYINVSLSQYVKIFAAKLQLMVAGYRLMEALQQQTTINQQLKT
jgi:hypothetical protein